MADAVRSDWRSPLAAALIAAALLSEEILGGRLLSVATWYSLGYLALTLGLLGMTAGALVVHLRPNWFSGASDGSGSSGERPGAPEEPRAAGDDRRVNGMQVALAVASLGTVVATFWTTRTRLVLDLAFPWQTLFTLLLLSVLYAIPFAGGGAALSVLLTRSKSPGRVYGADLIGSALGALIAAPAISWLGGPRALLLAGALPAIAMWVLARRKDERVRAIMLAAVVVLLGATPRSGTLKWIKGQLYPEGEQPLAQGWNSISYVRAELFHDQRPFYWGPLSSAPMHQVDVSFLRIDGEAGTAAYAYRKVQDLAFLDHDVTSAAHWLRPGGKALVIGVGGGRDVLAARLHGDRVDAVEVNPLFLDFLRGPLAARVPIAQEPEVVFHIEDGRSWTARAPEKFDVIVASLVDTWASTGMGALTLTENSLYTLEAWRLFLDKLTPTGLVSFSRWYEPSRPIEAGRLLALAAAALRERGVADPGAHLALVARGNIVTLVASPAPLTAGDAVELQNRVETGGLAILTATPWAKELLASSDVTAIGDAQGIDLRPPTDDWPFFFLQIPFSTWVSPSKLRAVLALEGGMLYGNVVAIGAVAAAFAVAALFGVLWLVVPLVRKRGALSVLIPGQRIAVLGWFAGLGAGFMLFEIATAQRLHLLLGDPTWALALTLCPLTLAAGLGAATSERLLPSSRVLVSIPGVVAALLMLWALFPGEVLRSVLAQPFFWRAAACVVCVAIPGFAMGFLFPLGIRRVQALAPEGAVWCWGVNGALSVAGSGAAVFLSVAAGISATLVTAALVYALVAAAGPVMSRVGPRGEGLAATGG